MRAEAGESAEGVASRVGKGEEGCSRRCWIRKDALKTLLQMQDPSQFARICYKNRLVSNGQMQLDHAGKGQECKEAVKSVVGGSKTPKAKHHRSKSL
jgi:hypothetical protein